jgi:hypothetical protein
MDRYFQADVGVEEAAEDALLHAFERVCADSEDRGQARGVAVVYELKEPVAHPGYV